MLNLGSLIIAQKTSVFAYINTESVKESESGRKRVTEQLLLHLRSHPPNQPRPEGRIYNYSVYEAITQTQKKEKETTKEENHFLVKCPIHSIAQHVM